MNKDKVIHHLALGWFKIYKSIIIVRGSKFRVCKRMEKRLSPKHDRESGSKDTKKPGPR